MSLNPNTSFRRGASAFTSAARRGAIALTAAGAIAAASFFPAQAQSVLATNPPPAASSKVEHGQCAAFFHYIVDEYKLFPTEHSKTFLGSALRFNRAGCAATDKDGEIQLITETQRDGETLGMARRQMGKYDILGVSGVKHCDRPPGGVCPTRTSANLPKTGG